MSPTASRLAVPALAALVAAMVPAQQSLSPEEFAEAARWFDGLGYPAVADRPFVEVATGQWIQSGNEPRRNTYVSGFLLDDDGRRFRVLTIGLDERFYERTPKDAAEYERVGYAVEPLCERARQALAATQGEEVEMPLHLSSSWLGPPDPSFGTGLFFVARTCAQLGEEQLARELAATALEAFRGQTGEGTLLGHLDRDLAHVSMWRLILGFGDRERPFADLLAECERFLLHFPDSEHAERAEATRAILQRMVQEERTRAPLAAAADEAARIAELVYRLREQNGRQWGQPGACDVFEDPRGEESPAHRLVACGLRAVPFLLPALDDDSFTRCVGCHRDFYFSHKVLRVRDVAAEVFRRITGTWVQDRAEAERVWRELEQQGELAFLIAGAEGGNLAHASRLVRDHPEVALPALRKGLAAVAQAWQRSRLLEIVSGLPGEAASEVLRAALGRADDPQAAVAAAVALFVRGERDAAVDGMIAAWQRGPVDIAARQVGGFLAVCGVQRAVEALAATPDRLGDDVLRSLGNRQAWLPDVLLPDGSGNRWTLRDVEPEAGVDVAIERLLASLLTVERRFNGNYGGTIDPEVRDFAAQALQQRWPDRYAFDFAAPRLERQRQIRQVANAWRQRQGLAPLPGPARPEIPTADAAALAELFEKARVEPRARRRRAVLDEIEALGLGALPAISAHAAAVENPERKAEWQALASRAASHVRMVRLAGGSAPFPAGIEAKALALSGRRLDPGGLADLLCAIGRGDAQQPRTASMTVTRADDGTGVVLELAFGGGARGAGKGVGYTASVSAGRDGLCDVTGAGVRRVVGERDHYGDFARALAEALAAPPDRSVDARYAMDFR